MKRVNEKKNKQRLTSTAWWVVTAIIILSLACSIGPVSLTWRDTTPESETALEPEATDTAVALEEETTPMVQTETPVIEEEATPTSAAIRDEVAPEESAPIPHAIPVGSEYGLMFVYRGQIYWLDLNTNTVHPILEGVSVCSARLSADQNYLIYYPREDETSTRWVVFYHLATGQETQYELSPEGWYTSTRGPDEKSFTYSVYEDDFAEDGVHGIYVYYLETGETETLIEDDIYTVYWVRSWCPDGERLIFSQGPNFSTGFITDLFNRETQEITELACRRCVWSPDGRYIAGVDVEFYYRVDAPLYLIDLARSETQVLFEREGFTADGPVWSPDGNWIAFTLYDVDEELLQQEHIYRRQDIPFLIDSRGVNLREIPVLQGQPILWSPDSSQVLLSVGHARFDRGDGQSLYLYDLNQNEAYLLFEFEESWAGSLQFFEPCLLGCE